MHETCWSVGVAVPWTTGGVSRGGLGRRRWLLSCVQVCKSYRMTLGIIDELPALLCAHTRGLCWCQAADWWDWCGCCARKRADCAGAKQRIGGTGAVAVRASAWIALATGNQLRAAYCVTVLASACRARSSAWTVEAGPCFATATSPGPPVRRAQARIRRRAGNGPRRVRAPTP